MREVLSCLAALRSLGDASRAAANAKQCVQPNNAGQMLGGKHHLRSARDAYRVCLLLPFLLACSLSDPSFAEYAQGSSASVPTSGGVSCHDGLLSPGEADVDCGQACSAPCASGSSCAADLDCASAFCASRVCTTPSCSDGLKDQNETDIDCGGETGCARCGSDKACLSASDCDQGACADGKCRAPSCNDGIKNQNESDVDCGGACQPCASGKNCSVTADCDPDAVHEREVSSTVVPRRHREPRRNGRRLWRQYRVRTLRDRPTLRDQRRLRQGGLLERHVPSHELQRRHRERHGNRRRLRRELSGVRGQRRLFGGEGLCEPRVHARDTALRGTHVQRRCVERQRTDHRLRRQLPQGLPTRGHVRGRERLCEQQMLQSALRANRTQQHALADQGLDCHRVQLPKFQHGAGLCIGRRSHDMVDQRHGTASRRVVRGRYGEASGLLQHHGDLPHAHQRLRGIHGTIGLARRTDVHRSPDPDSRPNFAHHFLRRPAVCALSQAQVAAGQQRALVAHRRADRSAVNGNPTRVTPAAR